MNKSNKNILYIVYRTTNLLNEMFYIGVHKTWDIDNDCYYGSGTYYLSAQDKYGKWNFEREVLYIYHSKEVAYKRERYIVNDEFISREDTYNLRLGGIGGDTGCGWMHCHTELVRLKVKEIKKERQSLGLYDESRVLAAKKCRVTNLEKYGVEFPFNSKESQEKSRLTRIKKYGSSSGNLNSKGSQDRKKATIIERYGNSAGHMHIPEVRSRAIKNSQITLNTLYGNFGVRMNSLEVREKMRETKISNSVKEFPELLNPCQLISTSEELVLSGTVLDISTFMYGRGTAVSYRHTILRNLHKSQAKGVPIKISAGKYKGYKINYICTY